MADDAAHQWGAEVVVTMKDGRRLCATGRNLVGRGGDNPMGGGEMWDKFNDCATARLPREQIAPPLSGSRLREGHRVAQVTRLLEVSELHKAPAKKVVFAPRGAQEAPETTWVP